MYLDKQNPHLLHESYTFGFSYSQQSVEAEFSNLAGSKTGGETEGLKLMAAKNSLQLMERRILKITQSLMALPGKQALVGESVSNDNREKIPYSFLTLHRLLSRKL